MTHFNHEWDTTKTPAVPVSVGDRYYAQDLNDDFNYLKHLPYEVFLQGRSRGVMVAPNDTWNNNKNTLTLSGGLGVILQDCVELDPNKDFTIPPKTYSSPRYERISFANTALVLPNDGNIHYIVATPTKRSLLQRTKALFIEQYASRVRYDGVITIQDTVPTAGQILIGLCHDKEYCLLIDTDPDQSKDDIVLKKWFGQNKTTSSFISILQSYYGTSTASIKTKIFIDTVTNDGISSGTFHDCTIFGGNISGGTFYDCTTTINVSGTSGTSISGGTFNNCTINIGNISGGTFNNCIISSTSISGGTFNNCTINRTIVYVNNEGIDNGVFNNCTIDIGTIKGTGIDNGVFNNCAIKIGTITDGYGIFGGVFDNCAIKIGTVDKDKYGIFGVCVFDNCTIDIGTANGTGIQNNADKKFNLTRINCSAITDLSKTSGKLNILNNTVLHAS